MRSVRLANDRIVTMPQLAGCGPRLLSGTGRAVWVPILDRLRQPAKALPNVPEAAITIGDWLRRA
ncbi:MAG: hypothetical protein QOG14_190 [Mycobacterium sp.]|jgi:hypothetical protein|nr:hypothetical protein [Mycobacterium sp.]